MVVFVWNYAVAYRILWVAYRIGGMDV